MVGYYGVGCGFGMEVRLGKSDRCGTVAIFGYVFWVHGYAAGWYGGLWRCVYGFPTWFVAARSVCSWVCGFSGEINLFPAFSWVCLIIFRRGLI